MGCRVDLSPSRSALNTHGTRVGVNVDAAHRGQVDDQAAVNAAKTGAAMTASADRDGKMRVAGDLKCVRDVDDGTATNYQGRPLVDHRVVQRSGVVVSRATTGTDDITQTAPLAG